MNKWNMKSKRFLLALMVFGVWVATLLTRADLFQWLTPYALGTIGVWMGFDSWKPHE
jgi:hypothetical protein